MSIVGYVYFIRSQDFVKIGFATNPRSRFSQIQGRARREFGELAFLGCVPAEDPFREYQIQHELGLTPTRGPGGGRPRDWFVLTRQGLDAIWAMNPIPLSKAVQVEFTGRSKTVELDRAEGDRGCACTRCGHEWIYKWHKPKMCPKCCSPYWNRLRLKDMPAAKTSR